MYQDINLRYVLDENSNFYCIYSRLLLILFGIFSKKINFEEKQNNKIDNRKE